MNNIKLFFLILFDFMILLSGKHVYFFGKKKLH